MKKYYIGGAALLLIVVVGGLLYSQRPKHTPQISSSSSADKTAVTSPKPMTINLSAKVLFIGDIMLARSIGAQVLAGADPFKFVQSTLDGYDYRVANVETTIASPAVAAQAKGKLFTFNAPLQSLGVLKTAGIDVSGLANNHTRDFSPAATADMLDRLKAAGLKTAGAGRNIAQAFSPTIVNVPAKSPDGKALNIKLAIVALNSIENNFTNVSNGVAGSAYFDQALVAQELRVAKQKADVVVVFPHWGVEYQAQPSAYQVQWGHWFIDHGADVVIGSHPHVVEPTEKYKGHYIVYSMGNFIFDQMTGNSANGQMIGLGLNVTGSLVDGKLSKQKISLGKPKSIPTHLDSIGFPHLR